MEPRNRFVDPLDEAIDQVRFAAPTEQEVQQSKARVWARLAEAASEEARKVQAEIRGCEDFRSLFPAYRAGEVSEARELLIQDHLRECGACRRAYESGERAKVLSWTQPGAVKRAPMSPVRRFALAASLVVAIGAGVWTMRDSFFPAEEGPRATLASSTGAAYLINASGQRVMKPGDSITEKEWIRTASGSRAMVKLRDGSMVEMNERTELAVALNRTDTTVFLDRGHVIVQAAKRRQGHLIVHTEDTDVYVTGTVFAVNRGVLGSRVSVAEGSVAVKNRRGDTSLKPGEQFIGSRFVGAEPVEQEFAWSANASEHLALLNELAKVKNQWQKMQLPELRYDSAILRQMPAGTVLFAGLPNLGGTVDNAWRIFQNQVEQSPVLKNWWTQEHATQTGKPMDEVVGQIKAFHEYLGKEVAFAAVRGTDGSPQFAFIADVTKSGLDAFIKGEFTPGTTGPQYAVVNNTLVMASSTAARDTWAAWAAKRADTGFASSGLGQRLMTSYQQGTGIIVGVDTQGLHGPAASTSPVGSVMGDVRYFVAEHRTLQQRNDLDSEVKASVSFNGPRKGLASMLAAPSSAGSLDYFSPNTSVVSSLVATRPEAIYDEFIALARSQSAGLAKEFDEIERRTGMSIRNDIAASLGDDASFGIDGPMLPIPAWKAVMEVRDPNRLQLFMERIVAELNTETATKGGVTLTKEVVDGRTLCTVKSGFSSLGFTYVFSDGFWILGSDKAAVTRALRAKSQNWRLTNSWEFRERLPQAPSPHYSALVYMNFTNVADMLDDAAGMALPPAQVESFRTLTSNIKPVLVCFYAESDAIRIQTRTGLLGLTMDQWLGASGLRELIGNSPLKMLNSSQSKVVAGKLEHRPFETRTQVR